MDNVKAYAKSAAAGGTAGGLTQIFAGATAVFGVHGIALVFPFSLLTGLIAGRYVAGVVDENSAPSGLGLLSAVSGYVAGTALCWGGFMPQDAETTMLQKLEEPTAIIEALANNTAPIDMATLTIPKIKAA